MHSHHDMDWGHRCRLMRGHKGRGERGSKGRGGWHGRHGRGEGGRGGGGRFFDHGELRHVVLALLREQPRHGYDIIREVEQRTGGAYCPSPGVIYPTLQLLEDVGHAAPATGDATRNSYQITAEGSAFLDENSALIGDILARMKQVGRSQAGAYPVIVAAMDNMKSALRSGTEPWSEAEAHEVAGAIDAAADRIRALRDGSSKASKK
jgi:DNA-binding PadR family transcriptional regulator